MKRLSLSALFFAAMTNIGPSTHDGPFRLYRGAKHTNAHKAPKQKQGKRECARRMRQMANDTHGY